MNRRRSFAAVAAFAAFAAGAPMTPAVADDPGTNSLASVLDADGNEFDGYWRDFDIVQRAALAVLEANPDSPVAVVADGTVALTAFLPTDRAFRRLVYSLTGERPDTEAETFAQIAELVDVELLETVLLYHVVPGATLTFADAQAADGAVLDTAVPDLTITVNAMNDRVRLRDLDFDNVNPFVQAALSNINEGNLQIAHGIDRVLRPIDLP
jgi:Fasciclin domain